jgi:hypothetical protein
MKIIMHQV